MIMYNEQTYVGEVTKRAKTLSKLFSLWFKMENVDRLSLKSRLPPRYITLIKQAWEALETIYPGRGDVQFEFEPEFKTHINSYGSNHVKEFKIFNKFSIKCIYFVIRFPDLTIKNSRRGSLDLKDLFIRIPVKVKPIGMEFRTIQGTRSTISLSEYSANYAHSHLSSVSYLTGLARDIDGDDQCICNYANFCLGEGDIVSVISLLCAGFDIDTFKLLLYQLETYASWESLEGGPHTQLSNAVEKNYSYPKLKTHQCEEIYRSIRNIVARNHTTPNLNWKLRNGVYEIVDDDAFDDFFTTILLPEMSESNRRAFFVYKDMQGEYFTSESVAPRNVIGVHPHWLPFRNSKVYFIITGTTRTVDVNTKRFINPRIKTYVRARLEQQANSTKIREAGTTRANTYDNSR